MRSTSTRSSVACPGRAVTTPSSTVDTVGSTPGEVLIVPTPRMNSAESLFDALVRKFTVGSCCVMVERLFRLASSSEAPVITDTASGVLCSGCSRLVAVMVTVSSWADCACACKTGKAASRAAARGRRRAVDKRTRRVRGWARCMCSPSAPRPDAV